MKITFKETNLFIPSWNGNKKLPEAEQIKIYWRYPNAEEVKEIRKLSNPKTVVQKGKPVKDSYEVEFKLDELLAVKTLVTKIENLNVQGKDIDNGELLIKTNGLGGLMQEASTEIMAEMDQISGNSKNS